MGAETLSPEQAKQAFFSNIDQFLRNYHKVKEIKFPDDKMFPIPKGISDEEIKTHLDSFRFKMFDKIKSNGEYPISPNTFRYELHKQNENDKDSTHVRILVGSRSVISLPSPALT